MKSIVQHGGNLLVMGCPGAGKSTVGTIVAETLGMTLIDFDSHLEKVWGTTVANKLTQLGSERFVEAENDVFQKFTCTPMKSLISLSGSNPMHCQFRNHARSLGVVFYLDVSHEDILTYLNKKSEDESNRIVGKHDGMTWQDIIEYRQRFYVRNYDVRILCEKGEDPHSIARKVVSKWRSLLSNNISYVSTRNTDLQVQEKKSFLDVVIQGLASDGGLFVPKEQIPVLTLGQWMRLVEQPYQQRACRILEEWIPFCELHPAQLQDMVTKAYENFQHKDIAPVKKLEEVVYVQELFYGPTASFKDLALQLMPQIFDEAVEKKRSDSNEELEPRYLVLVATSGDTGSAVLEGFKNCQNVSVMVLYPECGTSLIQKRQMTSMSGGNIKVVGVHGDFDFCQTTIKLIFNDKDFASHLWTSYRYKLSAANSINWGRLLPQIVYHASGYLDLVKQGEVAMGEYVDLCVPTGNFGNILAGFYAKKMGIPFHSLICASNTNNILTEFFRTGAYNLKSRTLIPSISPSIDILKSSNLERFLYHVSGENGHLVKNLFERLSTEKSFKVSEELHRNISNHIIPGWANEEECQTAIRCCFKENHYLPDPHTAVGLHVTQQLAATRKPRKVIVSATAHYSKFAKDVVSALGEHINDDDPSVLLKQLEDLKAEPEMSQFVKEAVKRPEVHQDVCGSNLDFIKELVENFVSTLATRNKDI